MNKLLKLFRILRFIFHDIYFNFRYLPCKQAIHLPILLYSPHFESCRGKIIIKSKSVHFGMIQLGFPNNHSNLDGIIIYNSGGILEFVGDGTFFIGSSSVLSVGKKGYLSFEKNISASQSHFLCDYRMIFHENCTIGSRCTFMDCDFHAIKNIVTGEKKLPYKLVEIGSNNWFGFECMIMKGTSTSDNIIVGSRSLLNKNYQNSTYSILAGSPAKIIKKGYYRDFDDQIFNINKYE
ncbi:hypothetical protein [uncultured Bacteroides sp.]|uniref:hypothetical protein n=1 Tax=uncultured Bacteroides sp. TaxID=162156 RepID=UPI002AAAD075|nr:hypothetical protein [uncultured Bacteroides sp.]